MHHHPTSFREQFSPEEQRQIEELLRLIELLFGIELPR
jgi:hypothetical protein